MNTKSFVIGVIVGVVIGGVGLNATQAPPTLRSCIENNKALLEDLQQSRATIDQFRAQRVIDAQKAKSYTVLFDGAVSAPQSSTGGFELLNLLRPGLGSALAKMSQPQANRFATPTWFLLGNVTAIFYGDPQNAVVMSLDSTGIPMLQGMPLSAAQVQANPRLLEVSQ